METPQDQVRVEDAQPARITAEREVPLGTVRLTEGVEVEADLVEDVVQCAGRI